MDQDNSKGQDKRNWRERLGIGAQGGKDLPKISDDFRKEPAEAPRATPTAAPRAPVRAAAPVRPAPMAPRATPKAPVAAAPKAPPAPPPVSPERLAERLRSQREASTRLAEQRVEVAKQRSGAPIAAAPVNAAAPAARPKYSFAEEAQAAETKAPVAPVAAPKPVPPPPVAPQPVASPPAALAPARPPLGGGPAPFPPRQPAPSPNPYAQPKAPLGYPPQPQPPYQPGGYAPQQMPPPYRPIDPATGYPAQTGFFQQGMPPQNRGLGMPPQPLGYAPAGGPRLNVPPRADLGAPGGMPYGQGYNAPEMPPSQPGFGPGPRLNRPMPPRAPMPPQPQLQADEQGYDDEFFDEAPAPRGGRRPAATDYQQAYREAEYGVEEEAPRSKAPWILAGLLLGTLVIAGLTIWLWQSSLKPLLSGSGTNRSVPVVTAPETPAKTAPETSAETPAAQPPAPTKKQIYDRIVGDQEVLAGEVSPPAEVPAAIPEPVNGAGDGTTAPLAPANPPAPAAAPATGAGEDAAPLPIPPPPGGGGDQQGSLTPADPKQSAEILTSAAGESQAAVVAKGPGELVSDVPAVRSLKSDDGQPGGEKGDSAPVSPVAETKTAALEPQAAPVPGDAEAAALAKPASEEAILDEPVVEKKKPEPVAVKKPEPVKKAAPKVTADKPLVLVAPAKKAATSKPKLVDQATSDTAVDAGGGLYAGEGIVDPGKAVAAAPTLAPVAVQPVKKKKTLADLFNNSEDDATAVADDAVAAVDPPKTPAKVAAVQPKAVAPKTVAPKPVAPVAEPAPTGGGALVQLASFQSRDEAAAEFKRLRAKHPQALGGFSPVITEAQVGGSTRFRLGVGGISSAAQASALCSSLIAAGERDCLVKKR